MPRQKKILPSPRERDFLIAAIELHEDRGYPPSLQEVADEMSVSLARVRAVCGTCCEWQWATKQPHTQRSLLVTAAGRRAVRESSSLKARG